jgi:hypothetical protein
MCCDLLSKSIFDLLITTGGGVTTAVAPVVICFQKVSLIY